MNLAPKDINQSMLDMHVGLTYGETFVPQL